ncbi:hypothetical protein EXIGLDRAFT_3731 [Exidia glandulosa HHB12029]|uniref:Uncharacterized protein n=1 Tax=Exidia glandulosa HHB12029 TaxID=1314781 RepID=A0A165QLS4_EXIGL|nr:hypothetical protein EXIGLDRAFT_3731 [Exidia glandulosa HHB12029]
MYLHCSCIHPLTARTCMPSRLASVNVKHIKPRVPRPGPFRRCGLCRDAENLTRDFDFTARAVASGSAGSRPGTTVYYKSLCTPACATPQPPPRPSSLLPTMETVKEVDVELGEPVPVHDRTSEWPSSAAIAVVALATGLLVSCAVLCAGVGPLCWLPMLGRSRGSQSS